jgi:AcrR family transcriptional regulator
MDQQTVSQSRREINRVNNRDAILRAAREVFTEIGLGATTVRDIIRRTDLASGTFYNYFQSKDEVFEALTNSVGVVLRASLRQVRNEATTLEDFVQNSFHTYFSYYADNPQDYHLMRANPNADTLSTRLSAVQGQAGLNEMREDIEAAMANNIVPETDTGLLTAALGGAAISILDEMMENDSIDRDEATRFATQLFMTGIAGTQRKP